MADTLRLGTRWVAVLVAVLLLAACGTEQPAVDGPEATAAEERDNEPAEEPAELNVAGVFSTPVEEPWNTAFLQAWERAVDERPHGLSLSMSMAESVAPPDAERVLREFAATGEYDIIWAHSTYWDSIEILKDEFPEVLWVYAGGGNEPLGGNAYWMDVYIHEPAYLMGMIAGLMTETNRIGAVAGFPFDIVNIPLNGFVAGAEAVNPEISTAVTYIESWFDPPTAREAAAAQIAAGADFVYAERLGPFEAVQASENVYAFGHFVDQNELASDVVLSSALAGWDPALRLAIDVWWEYVTADVPYDAPSQAIWFPMAEGGSALASFHDLEDHIPDEVKEAVARAEAEIMSGELEVPFDSSPLE